MTGEALYLLFGAFCGPSVICLFWPLYDLRSRGWAAVWNLRGSAVSGENSQQKVATNHRQLRCVSSRPVQSVHYCILLLLLNPTHGMGVTASARPLTSIDIYWCVSTTSTHPRKGFPTSVAMGQVGQLATGGKWRPAWSWPSFLSCEIIVAVFSAAMQPKL